MTDLQGHVIKDLEQEITRLKLRVQETEAIIAASAHEKDELRSRVSVVECRLQEADARATRLEFVRVGWMADTMTDKHEFWDGHYDDPGASGRPALVSGKLCADEDAVTEDRSPNESEIARLTERAETAERSASGWAADCARESRNVVFWRDETEKAKRQLRRLLFHPRAGCEGLCAQAIRDETLREVEAMCRDNYFAPVRVIADRLAALRKGTETP